jgi:hypothetical protein
MYNTESYKEPFWAENSGFMTGRDPLGIQNSSITTYARLLPGMTNLTLKVRYYGFYMWIIREFYNKQQGRTDFTHREHWNFIRRGELIIAYLMRQKAPEEQSVIGSNFTSDHENDIDVKGFYDIHLGADKLKETKKGSVYWDFRSGALGQYYAGALSTLKLIKTDSQFFQIEERGNQLADAFSKSIDKKVQDKFLEVIENGELSYSDIDFLDSFRLNEIKSNSEEWDKYVEIFLSVDGEGFKDTKGNPTLMRKETIKLLLEYFNKEIDNYNERSFIKEQYDLNEANISSGASFGWYYYYLNEAFHIALEGVFWAILVELDSRPQELESFIDKLKKSVLQVANSKIDKTDSLDETIISIDNVSISDQLNELYKLHKNIDNASLVLYKSTELMLLIYRNIENVRTFIDDFEKQYKVVYQKGKLSENIYNYVEKVLDDNYLNFIGNAVKKIMNDHVTTAYRKMGNGESNLLKFLIEDGIISHIQTMEPRHTSPRLKAIINFLQDLSLVGKDHKITAQGKELLKKLND